jgi:hypothetical protein
MAGSASRQGAFNKHRFLEALGEKAAQFPAS